jgi:hypothetical protein
MGIEHADCSGSPAPDAIVSRESLRVASADRRADEGTWRNWRSRAAARKLDAGKHGFWMVGARNLEAAYLTNLGFFCTSVRYITDKTSGGVYGSPILATPCPS